MTMNPSDFSITGGPNSPWREIMMLEFGQAMIEIAASSPRTSPQ